jgi:hypothetical protein
MPRAGKRIHLHPIRIVVADPIRFTEADLDDTGRDLYQRLSERVMSRIAAIQPPP